MFNIRKGQIDAFEEAARDGFHQRLVKFLRAELSEETKSITDSGLIQRIVTSEKRAGQYGIQTERGIARWVCLTFAAGLEFDELPEVKAYLGSGNASLTSEDKLDALCSLLG